MNQDRPKIAYVAGTAASDPQLRQGTKIGDLVSFRLAVTAHYPQQGEQYGETDWYDVTVKNAGLGQSVMNEIYKGAKVVAQGNVQTKPDPQTGETRYTIWADRVGLVEYLRREQVVQQAAVAVDDELGF